MDLGRILVCARASTFFADPAAVGPSLSEASVERVQRCEPFFGEGVPGGVIAEPPLLLAMAGDTF